MVVAAGVGAVVVWGATTEVGKTLVSCGLARAASEHFRKSGRLDEAVKVLERHAEAAPSSLELRVRLGVLLLAAEKMDEGEAVLKEVLRIDARQVLAHQALAKLYRKQEFARHSVLTKKDTSKPNFRVSLSFVPIFFSFPA